MSASTQVGRRPVLVWFFSMFYIVAALGTLAFCQMAFTTTSLPPGYVLSIAATALLTLVAAVAFLFLRRQAFHLFVLALAASLVMYAWPFVNRGEFPGPWYARMVSTVAGFGLMIAVVLYCRTLRNAGVLK